MGIQKSQGFKQLEAKPHIFSNNCEHKRCPTDRPMCLTSKQSTAKVHVLASRPRELCIGLPLILVEEPLRVCVPSILLNRKCTSQSKEGLVSASYHNTIMVNSAMVHNFILNVSSASDSSTQWEAIVTRSHYKKY